MFGVEPIRELLQAAPASIRVLHVNEAESGRFAAEIEAVRVAGGQVLFSSGERLGRMAGSQARHQGLVAQIREYNYANLDELLETPPDPLLVVDGVTDPRNVGAIIRSAECAGVNSVVLARERTAPITAAAIKTSAGAWAHMRIARCTNVARTVEILKRRGYWTAALAPGGETSLYDLDTDRRLALIVGGEGGGIRRIVRRHVDFLVGIPMYGRIASLNVSVATAIALFDLKRRRAVQG